jgi:hypothetical protein
MYKSFSAIEKVHRIAGKETVNILFSKANTQCSTFTQTVSTLRTFVVSKMDYPEIKTKAQAKLGALRRNKRLPSLSYREHLAYIDYTLKEVLLCSTIAHLGKS